MKTIMLACLLVAVATAAPARDRRDHWSRMKEWDADGDGAISRSEFRGPARAFDRMDTDGDGKITEAEANGRPADPPAPSAAPPDVRARIDADGDGTITSDEWAAFFAKADTNRDGRLDRAEWEAAVLGRAPAPAGPPKVGDPAPEVSAKRLGGGEAIDLAKPKRTTVLIFGSYT